MSTGPAPGCAATSWGSCGDSDIRVRAPEMAGWREHTAGSFRLEVFSGGHFYLGEQKAAVAGVITDTLRAATARPRRTID